MKKKKRFLSLFMAMTIAAVMTVPMTGIVSAAEPDSGKVQLGSVSVLDGDTFGFTDEATRLKTMAQAEELPASFDMREKGWMTPVRLQNPFGSCWAFAACASAESSLISSGLADLNIDLSEKHLAYFKDTPIMDKKSSQYGEGYKTEVTAQEKLNEGGFSFLATSVFASGAGPVLESEDPALAYRGAAGVRDYQYFDGKNQPYCYSRNDNWEIPYDLRDKKNFSLIESYILPTPAGGDNKEYHYEEAATMAIKQQLYAGRAVEIGFDADQSQPGQASEGTPRMSKDWAYYGSRMNFANHAVTIVGWDDTIGSEGSPVQFKEDNKPEGPGAWLVKNSWGAGTEPFPNHGDGKWGIPVPLTNEKGEPVKDKEGKPIMVGSGYFWLSYYDHSLSKPEALKFEMADQDLELQAYDYMPAGDMNVTEYDSEVFMGNSFRSVRTEQLEQIAFQSTAPGSTVHYAVYLRDRISEDFSSGYKVAEGDVKCEYGGFHKVVLPEPIKILNGQLYTIIVSERAPGGKYRIAVPFNASSNFKGVINRGESAAFYKGAWHDLSDNETQQEIAQKPGEMPHACDNFTIKAYTRALPVDFNMYFTNMSNLTFISNESNTVQIHVSGIDDAAAEKLRFQWSFEKDGIAKLEVLDGSFAAKMSVLRDAQGHCIEGSTYVFAEAFVDDTSLGTLRMPLTVSRPAMRSLFCTDPHIRDTKTAVYTGKPIEPSMEVLDEEGSKLPSEGAYTLTYKDCTRCGLATVTATAAGDCVPGTLNYNFVILPDQADITKTTAGAGTLTIEVKDQKASGITGYEVQYRKKGDSSWKNGKTIPAGQKSLKLTGLTAGEKYEVRVRAYVKIANAEKYPGIEATNYGEFSEIKTSGVVTPVQAEVTKLTPGKQQLTVTVKDQKATGIAGYQIQYRIAGAKEWKSKTLKAGKKQLVLKKLQKGKKYEVRVRGYVKSDGKTVYGEFSKTKKSGAVK